ncbi:MAG TPA: hypothetical protein VL283_02475, partial [Candidatus Baltobacteraceae bacterium]|nr:hypothetical protein [Candidatus Baltobacteraceae bacterium]
EETDIDQLMKSFEDKQRAHAIGEHISETSAELAKANEMELRAANDVTFVKSEAIAAAREVVAENLDEAIGLLDGDPSVAMMTLLKPVTERLEAKLDPGGGFGMPHGDPRVQEMYDKMALDLKRDAMAAVSKILEERWQTLQEGDPDKARIGRLIGLTEAAATEKKAAEEEIKPIADILEPEPPAPPKKPGFFQRLLGRK